MTQETTPDDLVRAIAGHIARRIGPIHTTFEEIISDDLRIDVHHVKSGLFRRYEVLVTSGMSARPMAVPPELSDPPLAEVLAVLPKGWPLSKSDFSDERHYWPLRLLKTLARYPHHANTWLGYGHTLANGGAEQATRPYAENTGLCAAALLPPMSLGEQAWSFRRADGQRVYFWAAVPLHMPELKYKLEHGIEALMDLFDKHRVTDRIDPLRPSLV